MKFLTLFGGGGGGGRGGAGPRRTRRPANVPARPRGRPLTPARRNFRTTVPIFTRARAAVAGAIRGARTGR